MIVGLDVAHVIPGHDKPFTDVRAALERAYARLAAIAADPARMARNALKACFIFNLFDMQSLPRAELQKAGAIEERDGRLLPTMAA